MSVVCKRTFATDDFGIRKHGFTGPSVAARSRYRAATKPNTHVTIVLDPPVAWVQFCNSDTTILKIMLNSRTIVITTKII